MLLISSLSNCVCRYVCVCVHVSMLHVGTSMNSWEDSLFQYNGKCYLWLMSNKISDKKILFPIEPHLVRTGFNHVREQDMMWIYFRLNVITWQQVSICFGRTMFASRNCFRKTIFTSIVFEETFSSTMVSVTFKKRATKQGIQDPFRIEQQKIFELDLIGCARPLL